MSEWSDFLWRKGSLNIWSKLTKVNQNTGKQGSLWLYPHLGGWQDSLDSNDLRRGTGPGSQLIFLSNLECVQDLRKQHHPGGIIVEETVTYRKTNIKSPTLILFIKCGVFFPLLEAGRSSASSFRKYQRCLLLCLRPPDNTIVQILWL